MQPTRGRRSMEIAGVALLLAQLIPAANADPITVPGYTVTDLGGGAGPPTFTTDSSGNGVVIASNGLTYSFQQTPNNVLSSGQLATLPLHETSWGGESNVPSFPFNAYTSGVVNSNGVVMATYNTPDVSHEYLSSIYAVQRNPDGTWGQPTLVQSSGPLFDGSSSGGSPIAYLSKSNEIVSALAPSNNLPYSVLVYNMSTNSVFSLSQLLSSTGYAAMYPRAISDSGQIVLSAIADNPAAGFPQTNILLTPDGVSSAPIEAPVPEPGAMAVMLLAAMSFAIGRVRERRRRS